MANLDHLEEKIKKEALELEELVGFKKKPWYKKIHLWLIFIFFIIIFGIALLYFIYWRPLQNSINLAIQTQNYFQQAQENLMRGDFIQARNAIEKAQASLASLDKNVNKLNSPLMAGYLKNQYDGIKNLISAIDTFSQGLYLLTNLSHDVLWGKDNTAPNSSLVLTAAKRQEILKRFVEAAPQLNGAKAQINLALLKLQTGPESLHPKLQEYYLTLKTKLVILQSFLIKAQGLAEILPEMLGLGQEKTYLFLLQNNHELRPTGGFIGTVGIIKIKNGELTHTETSDVYDYDKFAINKIKNAPPAPLKKYLKINEWYLRDSNWSADFPTALNDIEKLFHSEVAFSNGKIKDQKFDGIIAITPKIITDILGILGAIEVDSFIFNQDNFVDQLQYLVEVGFQEQNVPYFQRKNIVGHLTEKIVKKLENINLNNLVDIGKAVFNNLNQKHIIIHSKKPVIQNLIAQENWAGKINETRDDFIYVVDANLAALKSNQCVDRQIKYSFEPLTDQIKARLDITYINNCTFTWQSTRYRTYTRVYLPLGSKWISTAGSMDMDRSPKPGTTDIYEENNKTVFGTFIAVEPKKTGTLSFNYYLPDYLTKKILSGEEYRLYAQKQPGTFNNQLILNLNFNNPIKFSEPLVTNLAPNSYQFKTDLEIDRDIKISF
ncbi:MAG TPA: DUF4012 domain-containing protein [bacterium]|nr:DUF4012 domain-containing protein [bacterium]HPL95364.1 DUF4012 domain-containing protein [bacterium]